MKKWEKILWGIFISISGLLLGIGGVGYLMVPHLEPDFYVKLYDVEITKDSFCDSIWEGAWNFRMHLFHAMIFLVLWLAIKLIIGGIKWLKGGRESQENYSIVSEKNDKC